ncbi:MAG: hypothetical protein COA74_06425 [Gammaproteobacteria bacterium]|nr:MAG: hypothetical protein COA74_06425 [Gammaproteobacteria bacterium]
MIKLAPNAQVQLLGTTEQITDGYPWFRVTYNEVLTGFMWGGKLCAQDVWANGLYGRCESHKKDVVPESFDYRNNQASNIDMIDAVYRLLPGSWKNKYGGGERFGAKREIYDYHNKVIGHWHLAIERKETQGRIETNLRVVKTHYEVPHSWPKYFRIYKLDKAELSAKRDTFRIQLIRNQSFTL